MTTIPLTSSDLWYSAMGKPLIPYPIEEVRIGGCATCGATLQQGAAVSHFDGPAFSNHADFLRGYSAYVCPSCAWMYAFPKLSHRNLIAVPERIWWPMIGHDSATAERPQWLAVLREIATFPADTPVAGILTTDPKPRLWPRAELRTVGAFGLYIHCPDYDISSFQPLDLKRLLSIADLITTAISCGWTKRLILRGLFTDPKRAQKDLGRTLDMEKHLQQSRQLPEFRPALLIAGVPKHGK